MESSLSHLFLYFRSLNEIENVEENAAEDILQYGIQRYEQYHKTKYNILSFNI